MNAQVCPACGGPLERFTYAGGDVTFVCYPCRAEEARQSWRAEKAAMLEEARRTGKPVQCRKHTGGTVPINGTVHTAYPDGRFSNQFVDWLGNRSQEEWDQEVS